MFFANKKGNAEPKPAIKPSYEEFTGSYICLKKIDIDADIPVLYSQTHGSEEKEKVWTYLPHGPFAAVEVMKDFYRDLTTANDRLLYCIYDAHSKTPIGITALDDIKPAMGSLEVAHVLYSIGYQKTKANTEAIYLLLKSCIEVHGFRRIAWRCNFENVASRNAALRLGFEFEGVFQHHMIVKGNNRDTAWFGLMKERWPELSINYQKWLYNNDEKLSLSNMNSKVPKTGLNIFIAENELSKEYSYQ